MIGEPKPDMSSPKAPDSKKLIVNELPNGEGNMVYCLTDLKKIREKLSKLLESGTINEEAKKDISDLTRLAEASLMKIYEDLKDKKTTSYSELKEIVEVELEK